MIKSIRIVLIVSIMIFSMFITSSVTSSLSFPTNRKPPSVIVDLIIIEAFYTNLDEDEYLDILSRFDLTILKGIKNGVNRFLLFTALELPSGRVMFSLFYITTEYSHIIGRLEFYDQATEEGHYTLTIAIVLLGCQGLCTAIATYSFDPPEGKTGGDPVTLFIIESIYL